MSQEIRNIAIIAHVDHGKTTLVDKILHHCQLFRENESKGDLILDNNDLERERGITILSKNVSVPFKGNKINIIGLLGKEMKQFIKNITITDMRFIGMLQEFSWSFLHATVGWLICVPLLYFSFFWLSKPIILSAQAAYEAGVKRIKKGA